MLHTPPPSTASLASASVPRVDGNRSHGDSTFSAATRSCLAEPDAALLALGQRWRANEARLRVASNDHAASAEAQRLRRAIVCIPARTQTGIDLKIEIAASCIESPSPEDEFASILDKDDTATEAAVMWSLVRDLAAQQQSSPDAELIALGHLFNEAWAREAACWDATAARTTAEEAERLWNIAAAAGDATKAFADRIEALTATTFAGVLVKVRVCSWTHSGEPFTDDFFGDNPTTDHRMAAAVLRDLMAIGGHLSPAPAAARAA